MIQPLLLLAAATQGIVSTATVPRPAVVAVDGARPSGVLSGAPIMAIGQIPGVAQANEVARVRMRIAAGNRVLFDDELRVGRSSGASYSESRSEAPEINCPADRYSGGGGDRDSLNVQLYFRDDPQGGAAINVNVTWQRPTGSTTCPNEGARSVSLVQTVRLAPGETETVRGDAGLVVTLTRR